MPRAKSRDHPEALCEWCGKPIPDSRWGHGHPPKTCSDECRKARASQRERARYAAVKDTAGWKEVRAAYIEELKRRIEDDPELAELLRDRQAEYLRKSRAARSAERIKQEREYGRQWYRKFREALEADPKLLARFQAKNRDWYHNLSREDKARIYGGRRAREALRDLVSTGQDLLRMTDKK